MSLGTCLIDAVNLSKTLEGSEVYCGLFAPETPSQTWEWSGIKSPHKPAFTHFWVEHEDKIYDSGAEQFGYSNLEIHDKTNKSYIKVGKYENGKVKVLVDDPVIPWDDLLVRPSGGSINIIWKNPPKEFDYIR